MCITIWLYVTRLYFVNSAIFLYFLQARVWISNIICRGLFMFNNLRWEVIVRFVDIVRIVDRHCLYKYCHTGWLFVLLILLELLTVIVYINIVIQSQLQHVAELYLIVAYYRVIQYTIIAFILVEHRKLSTRYSTHMKAILFYYTETTHNVYNVNVVFCKRPNNFRYRKYNYGTWILNTLPVIKGCRRGDNLLLLSTLCMVGLFTKMVSLVNKFSE
jgi:hypothetical protein